MQILLEKNELKKCLKLLEIKEKNIEAAEYYIDFLTNHSCDITNAINQEDWFNQFNIIENVPFDIIENSKMEKITVLNENTFLNDSYYKTIGSIKAQLNSWQLMNLKYEKFEGFVSDEITVDETYFNEYTPISYFEKPFKYLAVLDKDIIWMSVIPHEINTMKKPIENAHGNVLVLGLGLGYYIFNILTKRNVTSVTVIENDKNIITLFNKTLLNKFPNIEKLNIVYDDAFKFIKSSKEKYDYIFSDIWHNVGDGEMLYLKLKALEKYHPEAQFDYWIEKSILAMLRRQTLTVFEEELNGSDESLYLKAKNENDKIINKIYFYLKNKKIKTFNDLHDILTDDSLKVMACELFKS